MSKKVSARAREGKSATRKVLELIEDGGLDHILLWDAAPTGGGMGFVASVDDLETLKRFHSTFTVEVAKRIAAAECPENVGSYLGVLCHGAIESLRSPLGKRKTD